MHLSILALSLTASLCAAAPSWSWPEPGPSWGSIPSSPLAAIADGLVVGTTTAVALATATATTATVNKFLGIPFAMSPPERFAPPQDPAAWRKPLNATGFKAACNQQFNYPEAARVGEMYFNNLGLPLTVLESEDCLYLNVFTPAAPCGEEGLRSVLFWMYGGALQIGTASNPFYDGSSIAANQDVVVVTINYRTNVFGFSNSPEIPFGQQNSGFLDQRKALEWVQKNIARFGGDPKKVTIFGNSAGGYSVKQLFANPPSPPTFHAGIMESEATHLTGGLSSWEALVAACNCTTASSPLACVRALPAETVESIIEHAAIAFPPVADNVTFSSNVAAQIADGTWAHLPFIIGTSANEGRIFTVGSTNLTAFLGRAFPGDATLQAEIAAQYPDVTAASSAEANYYAIADVDTNYGFQCPAMMIADDAAKAGYQAWRYYFNASFPNTQLLPDLGVYHGSEIGLVFGTYNRTDPTTQQIALSEYMQGVWASFAKNPAAGPGWPAYGSAAADLGVVNAVGEITLAPTVVDGKCAIYTATLATGL